MIPPAPESVQVAIRALTKALNENTRLPPTKSNLSLCVHAVRKYLPVLLALLDQPAGEGWRSIDSAPKNGTRVLLFNPDEIVGGWSAQTGGYYPDLDGWQYDGETVAYSNAHQPTHWQPLPPPPIPSKAQD